MFPGLPYLMEKSLSAGGEKYGKGLTVTSAVCLVFPFLYYMVEATCQKF